MALLRDFIDRYVWPVKRDYTGLDGLPTINGSLLDSILGYDNTTGENVTPRSALRNTTVYGCVNVRGNTIASLPVNVIQENGGKKTVLTDHAAYWLISQEPNSYMTAANFWKTIMLHVDVWGNAYAYINRDSRRNPTSLDIWEPWCVSVNVEDGTVWYTYKGETVPGRDVLHYRFYSFDGVCGRSPVTENQSTIGMGIKLDRYSALLTGKRPPGVLSYEGNLTPEQKKQNKDEWQSGATGDIKVLSNRWTFTPIMTPADDSAFAAAKAKNFQETCSIWQMPPTFMQEFGRATFNNAEQIDLQYSKHTITPICRSIELENNMKLFFEKEKMNTYTKFNMNGLLRGDLAARQAFYQAMVNTGIMNRNEARGYEDLNAYDGGEDFLVQGAMVPADMLREMMTSKMIPAAEQAPPLTKKLNGALNGNHIYQ